MFEVKTHELPPNRCGRCQFADDDHRYAEETSLLMCKLLAEGVDHISDALVSERQYCTNFKDFKED